MTLFSARNQLLLSLLLAGAGLSLFFGNDYRALGLPLGFLGVWLFVFAVWFFVDAVHRIPRSEAELAISPGEWQAWVGLAFISAVLVLMWLNAPTFAANLPISQNPQAGAAGRSIGNVFVAWAVLAWVLKQRWQGQVSSDERDHKIEQLAAGWGRFALTLGVISVAVLLGFSPPARLQAYSYASLAQLLMALLLIGVWIEHVLTTALYLQDRRADRA